MEIKIECSSKELADLIKEVSSQLYSFQADGLIKDILTWPGDKCDGRSALEYDKDEKIITVDEDKLMLAIQLANPAQKKREIVLLK